MIETWHEEDQQIMMAYAKDKLDQYECMNEYVTANGYSWERRDSVMGNDGKGGQMEVAYKKHNEFLAPKELIRIRDYAKWHLVRELKDVGIDVYKGKPHD